MTTKQVQVISLYGLGPNAHIARCRCGWNALSISKNALTDKLASHFVQSRPCYALSRQD